MEHLLSITMGFLFIGIWYLNPKKGFILIPAMIALVSSGVSLYNQGFVEYKDLLQHLSLDLILLAVFLYVFQFFKHLQWAILLLIFLASIFMLSHSQIPKPASSITERPELLIYLKNEEWKQTILDKYENEIVGVRHAFALSDKEITDLEEYLTIDIKNNIDPYKLVLELQRMEGVIWVEENQEIKLPELVENQISEHNSTSEFNDPLAKNQWHVSKFSISSMHEKLKKINKQRKNETIIAILDTGVDASHEDLQAAYKSSGIKSYDTDPKGHGTHCAGVANAISNNSKGVASLNPDPNAIKTMSIQVLNNFGFGSQQTIINGILKAADLGADVISLSLGGMTSESKEKAYGEAVKYAINKGAIVVVAAGNSGKSATQFSPANTKGVIAVTAIDKNLSLASFANDVTGLDMGLAAPGVNILSTFPNNDYKSMNGTSMAAPFVSGMIGLIRSYYPDINTEDVYKMLIKGDLTASNNQTTPIMLPDQVVDEFK